MLLSLSDFIRTERRFAKKTNGGKIMYITCLDLEGVLVPEIWIAFSKESGIPELKRTTRDEPDYNKLMNWRLGILREHHLGQIGRASCRERV